MKKKQMILLALVVSAVASVGVYRLIRKKMDEDGLDGEDLLAPAKEKLHQVKHFFSRTKDDFTTAATT